MSAPVPLIQKIENQFRRPDPLPEFRAGDTVKVWVKIREGQKTRLQAFEGVCIKRSHGGVRATFTVRKISYGVGVERVFAVNSPNIEKVEVVSRGKVRQARLYYLRKLRGKAARIKERSYDKGTETKKRRPRRKKRKAAKEAARQASEQAAAQASAEPATGETAPAELAQAD
ncbi:MAG: 50S ribosomal protein L19 [Proteobacteria bacterium]|nr:50S ribosomal protein L19 [Pseudomonadota bacterium]